MSERFWYLKHCDLFERLSPSQIEHLEEVSQTKRFPRKALIYLPSDRSDSVLLLADGRVKMYHVTSDGKEGVIAIIEPGELFGELACLKEPEPRDEFAEAMEPSTVVLIPGEEIQRLIEEQPTVAVRVTELLGLRRKRVERRLKSLLFRSNRERLACLLIELAERYGVPSETGIALRIRLSHQELAGMIGSTRETVTVVLGEMQNEGLLQIKRRQVILTNPAALAAGINEPPPTIPPPPSFRSRVTGSS